MTDRHIDMDAALTPFFAAARDTAQQGDPVPDDLMARVLADAAAAQPHPAAESSSVKAHGPSGFGSVVAALGGWPAAAGLAVVAGVGVLVGYSPPDVFTMALDGVPVLGLSLEDSPASMLADYDAGFLFDG